MEDIRRERPNACPTLKLNKKLKINVTKEEIWHTLQGIYGLSGLEKINNIAFLEVNL